MEKNPNTKEVIEQEVAKQRGKRKHRETACVDKRRGYFTCGICGSENLVQCGVVFCETCGVERPYVSEACWFHREQLECDCDKRYYYQSSHHVQICIDCDAVMGPLCPNCKRKCWAKGTKRYCKYCGYRSE